MKNQNLIKIVHKGQTQIKRKSWFPDGSYQTIWYKNGKIVKIQFTEKTKENK